MVEKETKSNDIEKDIDYDSYGFSYHISMEIVTICVEHLGKWVLDIYSRKCFDTIGEKNLEF